GRGIRELLCPGQVKNSDQRTLAVDTDYWLYTGWGRHRHGNLYQHRFLGYHPFFIDTRGYPHPVDVQSALRGGRYSLHVCRGWLSQTTRTSRCLRLSDEF